MVAVHKGCACMFAKLYAPRPVIVAHICNDIGKWGKGFVNSITAAFGPKPRWEYMKAHAQNELRLGDVQFIAVDGTSILVANMVAQHGVQRSFNAPTRHVDYDALRMCLHSVASCATATGSSVVMPRIGCGLGGGDWSTVEKIIAETLGKAGVTATVCTPSP